MVRIARVQSTKVRLSGIVVEVRLALQAWTLKKTLIQSMSVIAWQNQSWNL